MKESGEPIKLYLLQAVLLDRPSPQHATFFGMMRIVTARAAQPALEDRVVRELAHLRQHPPVAGEAELVRRLKAGSVTLIDVRPPEEYGAAHIPGAVSVPLEQINEFAKTVPKGRSIVAYCRGPYCVLALQAVAALRKRGITARRFEDGVSEWRAAGFPAEGAL